MYSVDGLKQGRGPGQQASLQKHGLFVVYIILGYTLWNKNMNYNSKTFDFVKILSET